MKYINFIFIFIYALFYKLKCVVSGNNKGTKTILIIFDKGKLQVEFEQL